MEIDPFQETERVYHWWKIVTTVLCVAFAFELLDGVYDTLGH